MAKEIKKDKEDKEVKDVKKTKKETTNKKVKKDNKSKKDNKNFFKEFKAELKRVSWPTFKQLVNNTGAVLAIVILVAVIVFVLDVIFENLNNFGVEKLKAIVTSSSSETVESDQNIELDTSNIEGELVESENSDEASNAEVTDQNEVVQEDATTQSETENNNGSVEGNN